MEFGLLVGTSGMKLKIWGGFILVCTLLSINLAQADSPVFSRTRHKAGLLALIEYNDSPTYKKKYLCKRAQLSGICRMLVQEGGYEPKRFMSILNITDPEVEYVAMIFDELNGAEREVPRLGSMVLAGTVAFAYTVPSPDGMRAAVHAGRLGGADVDRDAVSRAVYSLLIYAIEGKIESKDDLIKVAALNADSEHVGREIRAVRLAEWRKLPSESTLLGRLVRVLFIFRRTKDYAEAVNMGSRKLRYPESRKLLAVLSACWTDLPYLPENFVWQALMDKDNREICAELYQLSVEAILARVSEDMVYGNPSASYVQSKETLNGRPVESNSQDTALNHGLEFVEPQCPQAPAQPGVPGNIGYIQSSARVEPIASPPDYAKLRMMEDQTLSAIPPLAPLASETVPEIKVVEPVGVFADIYYPE